MTSTTLGTNVNSASGVTTNETPTIGTASNTATLTVVAPPTISKAFLPTQIAPGGTSTITFTLSNSNSFALTGASFSDTLTNMSISGAQNAGGTCVGASSNSLTNGQTSLSLSGITIPANGNCSVTVDVTSTTLGSH